MIGNALASRFARTDTATLRLYMAMLAEMTQHRTKPREALDAVADVIQMRARIACEEARRRAALDHAAAADTAAEEAF
jgi:hypothetical protein